MEIDVTDETFEKEVIEKSKDIPVLVDFWASWCGPCVILKPILERISKDYGNKIILAKLDVNKNTKTASKYSVMSIPSVKLFKKGKIIDEFTGLQPEEKIREWLKLKI
ncbi:MAG: thioredoxin [Candidatus Pacearchaeota archaeon]